MSFSNEVKAEMLSVQMKKNCCKKAFLMGLLYNASTSRSGEGSVVFTLSEAADAAQAILGDVAKPSVNESARAGKKYYTMTFTSKAVSSFLYRVSCSESIESAAAFRCEQCKSSFIRGALISLSTINDPRKSYHLEIAMSEENAARLGMLEELLCRCGFNPKLHKRPSKVSLYFKSNTQISDLLSYAGAMKSSFDVANVCIERDIRNNENRATNCVATNISKSVEATRRQIDAINKLIQLHKLEALSDELIETARLRLENEDISLSELALMHEPPISKSGLNHRLKKLCDAAEECSSYK